MNENNLSKNLGADSFENCLTENLQQNDTNGKQKKNQHPSKV